MVNRTSNLPALLNQVLSESYAETSDQDLLRRFAEAGDQAGRVQRERSAVQNPAEQAPADPAWEELLLVLDEEMRRLPQRYQSPLLLCYLEGRTQDEAARQLGWSLSTLRRRLERGREAL